MTNWIKHTPGEKRPVPKKWLKAVKDSKGWVLTHLKLNKKYREHEMKTSTKKTPFQQFCEKNEYDPEGLFIVKVRGPARSKGDILKALDDDGSYVPFFRNTTNGLGRMCCELSKLTQPKWTPHTPGDPAPVPFEWLEAVEHHGIKISAIGITDSNWWNYRTAYKVKPEYHLQHLELLKEKEDMTTPAQAAITHEIIETITVSCSETDRSTTLSKPRYEEIREVVDHWVRGGEVEFESISTGEWLDSTTPNWCNRKYRIKQRQPKAGEVWKRKYDGELHVFGCALNRDGGFLAIDGKSATSADYPDGFEYHAPSVKAAIAREIWGDIETSRSDRTLVDRLYEACQFDN